MFTATAKIKSRPIFQTCDNTGKRFTEAELEQKSKSQYAGKVEIGLGMNGTEIITLNAIVMNGRVEKYVIWAGESSEGYTNFRMDGQVKKDLERLAMNAIHKNTTMQVEL